MQLSLLDVDFEEGEQRKHSRKLFKRLITGLLKSGTLRLMIVLTTLR